MNIDAIMRSAPVIPVLILEEEMDWAALAETFVASGLPVLEVTLRTPVALDAIRQMSGVEGAIVGAGTVLDLESARPCVDAGVAFLTSPGLDLEIVEFAKQRNLTMIAGALTPTEIVTAWKAGSDFVKVFPCAQVGGDSYIRALKGPFPSIPLIAAGGVNQQTAVSFILAGAAALGIGRELIPTEAVQKRQEGRIRELAHRFLNFVRTARSRSAAV